MARTDDTNFVSKATEVNLYGIMPILPTHSPYTCTTILVIIEDEETGTKTYRIHCAFSKEILIEFKLTNEF
jgi:hypothetical protein